MDILEELPVEQWPILQAKLKKLWPLNLPGYYTLHVNLKYPAIRDAFKFKVYCPYGNMDNGFVGFNTKGPHPDIIIFSMTEDTSKIEEAILKTKLIDWDNGLVFFDVVTSLTLRTLQRVNTVMKFGKFHPGMAKMFHLDGNTKPFTISSLPDKTYLTSVKLEDIHQVDDTWPYKYSHSHEYLTTLASNGLSYGLYSSETNGLLAWVFINEYNFLCHLYCGEKHRMRGYGKFVMQCAVNDLLKDGHDVYAYVVPENVKPLALFSQFGFKIADEAAFIYIVKNSNKNNKYFVF
ncbi:uncharacterized protein LOC142986237 [Anticarsia gemmatalis]|uniref:uncharacterized protein LOC142986237 n=1 Tax=Anticarsia gemmatalis TaxID=129554 RepID=UPI003F76E884